MAYVLVSLRPQIISGEVEMDCNCAQSRIVVNNNNNMNNNNNNNSKLI